MHVCIRVWGRMYVRVPCRCFASLHIMCACGRCRAIVYWRVGPYVLVCLLTSVCLLVCVCTSRNDMSFFNVDHTFNTDRSV